MTYYATTPSLSPPALVVADFMNEVATAVMDDILESMQIKHKLVSLSSKMTVAQKSQTIKLILQGLQSETTPLSDYYIQSSVGSLLEYISQQTDCLNYDASIVTISAALF